MPSIDIPATAQSIGRPLKGGVLNIEIRVKKDQAEVLHLVEPGSDRSFDLNIGKKWYSGVLYHREAVPNLYFSPSLVIQGSGEKSTLGAVLSAFGVREKARLVLKIGSKGIWVTDKWGNQLGTRASRLNLVICEEPKTLEQLCKEANYDDEKSAYQHVDQNLVKAGFVERLPNGRYRAKEMESFSKGSQPTITEKILAGTLRLLESDLTSDFDIKELRRECGVNQAAWKASYGPTFQGMRENTTSGAPLVRVAHRGVFQKVRRGAYRLTEQGRDVVRAMIPPNPSTLPGDEADGQTTVPIIGGGFGNWQDNEKVENAAIDFVTKAYSDRGWHVDDVSPQNRGYDLFCTSVKDEAEEHVEVKGVRGSKEEFIITAGEVRTAEKDIRFVLCVVTAALSEKKVISRYSGKEMLRDFVLTPVQYRATKRK